MTDFSTEAEDQPFEDVTVRMTLPASLGGERVRAELSNRYGTAPVFIGRAAIGVRGQYRDLVFDGLPAASISDGASLWSDPVDLPIAHGDDIVVDLHLPEYTPYETAGGFVYDRSIPGDHVGASEFPFHAPRGDGDADETGWSLPAGGPFLRAIEVAGTSAKAVVVGFGASITTMGWPQFTSALLTADDRVAVLNRGIPGNRMRFDGPTGHRSFGPSGLHRFSEDVLQTTGVTHVVLAHSANDITLPGVDAPIEQLPTADEQIDTYTALIEQARAAGLEVILATVTPLRADDADADREDIRRSVNDWIRSSGERVVDFDALVRSDSDPTRIAAELDAGDHLHPNVRGQRQLARGVVRTLRETGL